MKKIAILLLTVLMVFGFVACDNSTPAPEEKTPTNEEIVISYIDSIKMDAVKNDLLNAAKGDADSVLVFTADLNKITMGENGTDGTVIFDISIAEGKEYSTGFWNKDEEGRKVTTGKATVTVNGTWKTPAEGNLAAFTASSYKIESTADTTVVDKNMVLINYQVQ